jgi:hypothetical protein
VPDFGRTGKAEFETATIAQGALSFSPRAAYAGFDLGGSGLATSGSPRISAR